MIRRAAALLLLCAAPAVHAAGAPGASTRIVGGVLDDGDPGVVLVTVCDPNAGCAFCTGVLLAPRVVATAAHCVRPVASSAAVPASQVNVFTGTTPTFDSGARAVVALATAAGWDDATLANDLALLRLDGGALGPAPIPMNRTAIGAAQVGAEVRLVGYGLTSASGYDSGVRRDAVTHLDEVAASTLRVGSDGILGCGGDSGAPLLMTVAGKETVAGIVAYGDGACASYTIGERLDVHAAWIDAFVAESGGYGNEAPRSGGGGGCATGGGGELPALLALAAVAMRGRRRRTGSRR